jgi:enterobactin synthetase component D
MTLSSTSPPSLLPRLLERRSHGVVMALPIGDAVRAPDLLSSIHDDERALTEKWGELRVRTFAAGRVALRAALREVGVHIDAPILRDARGAPVLPAGVLASVSHKDELALAIAQLDDGQGARIGVDVELLDEANARSTRRIDVSKHILTARELLEVAGLDEQQRRIETLARFSLKESLYKALDPFVQRYVGFLEVEVRRNDDGTASFTLELTKGEGPFDVDGTWSIVNDPMPCVLTSVRVKRP